MLKYLVCLFLFCSSLCANEEIVVHLGKSSTLIPLHFSLDGSESGFGNDFVKDVEKVLRFDFNQNGKTTITSAQGEYEINAKIKEKKLSLFLTSKKDKKVRAIEAIPLTGTLSADRKKIHEASDTLFEALFDKKGIASTHILYTVRKRVGNDATEWETEIYECDYDGANARQITHDGKLCVTPLYSGGKDFLYVSYKTGQPKLYFAKLKEGNPKRVTLLRGNQLTPAISKRGDLIAFVCDIMGNPEIFAQKFDPHQGIILEKPWQITSLPNGAQGSPTFSPDNKKIAFVSNKDGTPRIYVSDLPTPGSSAKELKLQLISKACRENTCPIWSPDGTKLAYSGKVQGVRQIWIYDFKTGKETQLTSGSGDKENASWANNSEHLVFHNASKNGAELYLIHLAQKDAVKISQGNGEKRFPCWKREAA